MSTLSLPSLLRKLLAEYGHQLTYDARLLQSLLTDLYPDRSQARIVVHVVEQGVAPQLWQLQGRALPEVVHRRMVKELEDGIGLKPEIATLGIHLWAEALGVHTEDQSLQDQLALLSFVDDLIRDRHDPNIKPENIAEVRQILLRQLNQDINIYLINCLADKDQVTLGELLDGDPTDYELNQFFIRRIPNLSVEIASVLLRFRTAYLYPITHGGKHA